MFRSVSPRPVRLFFLMFLMLGAALGATSCNSSNLKAPDVTRPDGAASADASPDHRDVGGSTVDGPILLADAGQPGTNIDAPPEPSTCAAEVIKADPSPADLLLLVDTSGSMLFQGGERTKWGSLVSSLLGFMNDPFSNGLGVGLQFFPPAGTQSCQVDDDCDLLCWERRVCWGPNGAALGDMGELPPCGTLFSLCPPGTMCRSVGACSVSGADCLDLGKACGGNEGICTPPRTVCLDDDDDAACRATSYEKPAVPIGELPGGRSNLTAALLSRYPVGGTPLGPAIEGAMNYLRAAQTATPTRRKFLVLASDGLPDGCSDANQIDEIVGRIAKEKGATPSIGTYVIGTFASNEIAKAQPEMDKLAAAGGTSKAFVLTSTDDLTQKLKETLGTIRSTALACEYKVPPAKDGKIDFGKVNVRFTPAAGAPTELLYVASADKCDPTRGGWYFDVDPKQGMPTTIQICPAACKRFQAEVAARVDLVFGCMSRTVD